LLIFTCLPQFFLASRETCAAKSILCRKIPSWKKISRYILFLQLFYFRNFLYSFPSFFANKYTTKTNKRKARYCVVFAFCRRNSMETNKNRRKKIIPTYKLFSLVNNISTFLLLFLFLCFILFLLLPSTVCYSDPNPSIFKLLVSNIK
jgi:hypothetical protein